jgi:hypothetical protein
VAHKNLESYRNSVLDELAEHYAHGKLSEEQYEARLARAQSAENVSELESAVGDLPQETGLPPRPADRPSLDASEAGERSVSFMSSRRLGVGDYLANQKAHVAIMSNLVLDFRGVSFGPGVTNIEVFALMADVRIIPPEDVDVRLSITPLLANVASGSRPARRKASGEPSVLRISGTIIMAEIRVD